MPAETERSQTAEMYPLAGSMAAIGQPDEGCLRRVFDSVATGLAQCSRDLRYISVNCAYARIAGLAPDQIEGRSIVDVVGARAFDLILPSIEQVLRGDRIEFETPIPFAFTGSPRWAHVVYTPDRSAAGEIAGWISSVIDITERKRAADLLAEQRHLLDLISAGRGTDDCLIALTSAVSRLWPHARAAVVMADPSRTRIEYAVASEIPESFGEGIHGAPVSDLGASTCGKAIFEGKPASCADIANDIEWSQPWRNLCMAHGVRSCHSTPVFVAVGKAVGSFLLCFDGVNDPGEWECSIGQFGARIAGIVIDRDRAAQALRETEMRLALDLVEMQRLQSISSAISHEGDAQGLYNKLLDAATAFMRSDFASVQMLSFERSSAGELLLLAFRGFSPEAARFWGWVDANSSSSCGAALRAGNRVIVSDVEQCDWMAGSRDLEMFRHLGIRAMQTTPLISRGGKLLGMLSTHWRDRHRPLERELRALDILARQAADLIERQSAAEMQRQAEAALRKSEKFAAAGRMAATIAHEINNPLEAIVNLSYLLSFEKLSPNGQEILKSLGSELTRVSHITKQTLEFYRDGKAAGPVDLAETIEAAVSLFARKAAAQGARIETHYFTQAMLFGFAGELRQVFANLIGNALEAGSRTVEIRVSPSRDWSREGRRGVCIIVADNGSGIPDHAAAKVFEPFFTTKEDKGTGLGLWVSKGIVQKHEGWIRVRSSRQSSRSGTSFCIFFPSL